MKKIILSLLFLVPGMSMGCSDSGPEVIVAPEKTDQELAAEEALREQSLADDEATLQAERRKAAGN